MGHRSGIYILTWAHAPHACRYHARVACLDDVLKEIVGGFKAQPERWENTLMVMSTDNGGPIFAGANNYPLRYIYTQEIPL